MNKTLEDIALCASIELILNSHGLSPDYAAVMVKRACLEYAQAQDAKIAALEAKMGTAYDKLIDSSLIGIGKCADVESLCAKVAELQTKLTETNELLLARELLLTHQHDDVVKLEDRVKELEADGKRLDWLNGHVFPDRFRTAQEQTFLQSVWWNHSQNDNTSRRLIDAEMAQQPKEHH